MDTWALASKLGDQRSRAVASEIAALQSNVGDDEHKALASEIGGRRRGL